MERRSMNWLDGRTPMYILVMPEYDVAAVAEDPITMEDAVEALEKDSKEDDEDEVDQDVD